MRAIERRGYGLLNAEPSPRKATGWAYTRRRVCQLKGVTGFLRLLPACAETAVEGDVEGVQGTLPPVGPALAAAAGGVEADDDEVEVLEGGLLGGEVAAGLDRAAEPGVQRLDRVGRADQRADLLVEGQEGNELGPGVLPEPYDRRVPLLPLPGEISEPVQRRGLGRRGVNRLQVFSDLCPVPLRYQ